MLKRGIPFPVANSCDLQLERARNMKRNSAAPLQSQTPNLGVGPGASRPPLGMLPDRGSSGSIASHTRSGVRAKKWA